MNLFGVPRRLEALIQASLSFMWPLGSILKTVWDIFWGVMKPLGSFLGSSWKVSATSWDPKMAFGRSWGRWSCTFAPRFCHYGNLVFKRVLGSSFSNCFGVMLKPKTVILLWTSFKNQKKRRMCRRHQNIKILSFWQRFLVQFWGHVGAQNSDFAMDIL